jgi:hypothetical protein
VDRRDVPRAGTCEDQEDLARTGRRSCRLDVHDARRQHARRGVDDTDGGSAKDTRSPLRASMVSVAPTTLGLSDGGTGAGCLVAHTSDPRRAESRSESLIASCPYSALRPGVDASRTSSRAAVLRMAPPSLP